MNKIHRLRSLKKIGDGVPPPFPNGWYAVAESKEVKKGQAISVDCLGENFVVFRTEEGIVCMDAYCTHMGANLGVGGLVKGNCIECPFHQWKFSGKDGSLVDIPYSTDMVDGE